MHHIGLSSQPTASLGAGPAAAAAAASAPIFASASVPSGVLNTVIVSGLTRTGAPELNGRTGVVEGFDDVKGRYAVRVGGRQEPAALRQPLVHVGLYSAIYTALRPHNCLAGVPGSAAA